MRLLFKRLDVWADQMQQRPVLWLAVFAAVLAIQISPWWYPTNDGSTYLLLAESAAANQPNPIGLPRFAVPPGYPLAISPAYWFADRPFWIVSAIHWVAAVVYLVGCYVWARRWVPSSGVLMAGLAVINASVMYHYRRTLKETVFMALMIWTVIAMRQVLDASSRKKAVGWTLTTCVLMASLVMTRYSGIVLAGGLGLALLLKVDSSRSDRLKGIVVGGLVGMTGGAVLLMLLGSGPNSYVDEILSAPRNLTAQLVEGVRLRVSDIGRVSVPGMFKSYSGSGEWLNVNMAVYIPLTALAAVGWWRCVRRTPDVLLLALPLYLGMYIAWPFGQGARFLVPMIPALTMCYWFGLERQSENSRIALPAVHRRPLFVMCLVAHILVGLGYWVLIDAPRAYAVHQEWPTIERLAQAIPSDRDQVMAANLPCDLHVMLELELRRDVRFVVGPPVVDPDSDSIRWIVQPREHPVPEGFANDATIDGFSVLVADQPEPPPSRTAAAPSGGPSRAARPQ